MTPSNISMVVRIVRVFVSISQSEMRNLFAAMACPEMFSRLAFPAVQEIIVILLFRWMVEVRGAEERHEEV